MALNSQYPECQINRLVCFCRRVISHHQALPSLTGGGNYQEEEGGPGYIPVTSSMYQKCYDHISNVVALQWYFYHLFIYYRVLVLIAEHHIVMTSLPLYAVRDVATLSVM